MHQIRVYHIKQLYIIYIPMSSVVIQVVTQKHPNGKACHLGLLENA